MMLEAIAKLSEFKMASERGPKFKRGRPIESGAFLCQDADGLPVQNLLITRRRQQIPQW